MINVCDVSTEDLVQALIASVPGNENISILETIQQDHTVIFTWQNRGYVASSYIHYGSSRPEHRVAVGRIHPEKYPEDRSHIMLEQIINSCITAP